jgi:Domain of unknown function (DUF1840)
MIVTFSTRYGQIKLLGESAVTLLGLAGHSGAVPGAVLAQDLPAFLGRLRAGLESHGDAPSPPPKPAPPSDDDEDANGEERDAPARVTLRMRAVPLIDMIETAIARGSDLMWERG